MIVANELETIKLSNEKNRNEKFQMYINIENYLYIHILRFKCIRDAVGIDLERKLMNTYYIDFEYERSFQSPSSKALRRIFCLIVTNDEIIISF